MKIPSMRSAGQDAEEDREDREVLQPAPRRRNKRMYRPAQFGAENTVVIIKQ